MSHNKLVYMANQIGKFFLTQKHTAPAEAIADHLAKFWDPAMRAKIVMHLDHGGEGLDPEVAAAVRIIASKRKKVRHEPAGANEA